MATPPSKKQKKAVGVGPADEDQKEKEYKVCWIDDHNSLKLIQTIEKMPTSKLTVAQFVCAFQSARNHPVALACLADKVTKIMGDVTVEYASSIFAAHGDDQEGFGLDTMKLSAMFSNLADTQDGTLASDTNGTLKYLPRGISVNDWSTAIAEAFGNNSCYCRGVGTGVTQCADFVRLAAPLRNPKKCKVSDLFDLFRHLWECPFIATNGWTEEMQKLHKSYNTFIQDRPWLYRALDPGFVMAEGLAPAALAALMGNVPIAAPGDPGPATLGISNPPVALANLNTVYQVADLEEARRAAMYIQGANPGIHGFGVGTALGNVFIY
jgi:hypothetical protein